MIIDVNNIYCKCTYSGTDLLRIDIPHEIDEYLKVKRPTSFFVKKKKGVHFDAYKHYYSTTTHKFPTGFLPNVLQLLRDLEVNYTLEDQRGDIPKLREGKLLDTFGDKTLFDHQVRCVKSLNNYVGGLYFPRGIIDAATNAGKTLVMQGIFDNIEGCKALVIIHSDLVFRQLVQEIGEFFEVGTIHPKYPFSIKTVTIAMNKTLLNRLIEAPKLKTEMSNYFNTVIIDEGHKAGGDEYQKILKALSIPIRIVVSGTPLASKDKVKAINVIAQTGPVLAKVTNQEVIDLGHSKRPIVHMIRTANPEPSKVCIDYTDFVEEHKFFNPHALAETIRICRENEDKQIVIIFDEIRHGKWLYSYLAGEFPNLVELVHGVDAGKHYKIEKFKKYDCRILITSTILKEGVNIKNIDVMINHLGEESTIATKQFMGRGLRTLKDGPTELHWYDFYHDCKHLSDHSRSRINIYKKEGYEIIYHYPNRNGKPLKQ